MAAEEGIKRWAIAPPPPQSAADTTVSGEFALGPESELLDPDSKFLARSKGALPDYSQVARRISRSVSKELGDGDAGDLDDLDLDIDDPDRDDVDNEVEPFDSDRPTLASSVLKSGYLGLERDMPTIPAAPLWGELEAEEEAHRPPPRVATKRGFFLESVCGDGPESDRGAEGLSTLPPARTLLSPERFSDVDIDADEGL